MKVLVTAATRHGSTFQIADAIREELEATGLTAHALEPAMVTDVAQYDAVVLGSAVYAGRWLGPARKLVDRFEADLLRRPVWLFSSGPLGEPAKPTEPPVDGLEMTRRLNARDHQVFEGRLDRQGLGIGERLLTRAVKAPDGDYRSWPAIATWARGISRALRDAAVPAGSR